MASGSSAQSGIDILCDAAGSHLLSSSYYPVQQGPDQPAQAQPAQPSAVANTTPTPKNPPTKRRLSDTSSTPSSSHVCHICRRVYERADHLTRHLRSHENARLYQCSRCPKRFNRADLLTRHEATHDRDGATVGGEAGKNRTFDRRSDRAAEACLNCSASKSKCEDQKPCTRCRNRGLPCEMPPRRGTRYRTSDVDETMSASDTSAMTPGTSTALPGLPDSGGHPHTAVVRVPLSNQTELLRPSEGVAESTFMPDTMGGQPPMGPGFGNDMVFFNSAQNPFQEMDFSWDLNFENVTLPQFGGTEPGLHQDGSSSSNHSSRTATRDHSRGHAAFQRSPWLWEPEVKDNTAHAKEGLTMLDEAGSRPPALASFQGIPAHRLQISATTRDTLFAIVLGQNSNFNRVPSFPSVDLLSHLLQAHFARSSSAGDYWIHLPSFDPAVALPELIAAIIASGATSISTTAIWRFGFALQEVVRVALGGRFEGSNSTTRDLMTVQAYMLELEIGQWSGFSRKMEIAESFLGPLLTMLRRSGKMSPVDSDPIVPAMSDSIEILNTKWKNFVQRESYKRLVLHLFFHDAQSSIGLCKNPLMSYNELCFGLPASRDLWTARSAEEWRNVYLTKAQLQTNGNAPRISELTDYMTNLDELGEHFDVELCCMVIVYSFWGQILAYREAVKLHSARNNRRAAAHHVWIKAQHQELYRDLCEFASTIRQSGRFDSQLVLLAELFMMILHVSPDELQKFAGKEGEDEARRTARSVEDTWADSPESRYAVWHAGQVFLQARKTPPTSLRGFNAIAVYLASLTLWVYGLVSGPTGEPGYQHAPPGYVPAGSVLVDDYESSQSKAFLEVGQGLPAVRTIGGADFVAEPLSNQDSVLSIAQNLLRDNYPSRKEAPPPLVESLVRLMQDLGSGSARAASEVAA